MNALAFNAYKKQYIRNIISVMSSNLQRFNSQLESMLNDLIRIFPDARDIKVYREKFLLAKSANSQMVLLIFLKYIYPYKKRIIEQDESFFLSDNLTNELITNDEIKKQTESDSEYILTQALGLKTLWRRMDEEQQETLWKYFKVLVVLCERYINDIKK